MKKKYNVLKIVIFFIVILVMTLNFSFGESMSINNLTGTTKNDIGDVQTIGNKIITIVSTIGSILSVIVIIVLGMKYMLGSVEERAEYKKSFMPYFIGAMIIFAASTLAGIIYEFAIKINKWYNIYYKA